MRVGEPATLTGPHGVRAGDEELEAKHILLCTGSRPAVPPIAGLAEADPLTSETVLELPRAPRSLTILGGGPIGIELAQAFQRLGTTVTVLQKGPRFLPRDEPELVDRLVGVWRARASTLRSTSTPSASRSRTA